MSISETDDLLKFSTRTVSIGYTESCNCKCYKGYINLFKYSLQPWGADVTEASQASMHAQNICTNIEKDDIQQQEKPAGSTPVNQETFDVKINLSS